MNTIVDDGVWAALPTSIQNELREQGIMPSRLLESSSAPPGMDPAVWMSLPEELKQELREELLALNRDAPFVLPVQWTFIIRAFANIDATYQEVTTDTMVSGIKSLIRQTKTQAKPEPPSSGAHRYTNAPCGRICVQLKYLVDTL